MDIINNMKNEDHITLNMFGQERDIYVFSTGDNVYDENGNSKEDNFDLNEKELECLNWFLNNVKIEDYKKEIVEYCNDRYSEWSEKRITEEEIDNEVRIKAIAINIKEIWKAKDGFVYPEISFYGICKCDPEHGICIGFRDKQFLGINPQDWTL